MEKQLRNLLRYSPWLSQHHQLTMKPVFSPRLQSHSFAKTAAHDDGCVSAPSVITSVTMTKQKSGEGNQPASKFIKCVLCKNSNPQGEWEQRSGDLLWRRLIISSTYWLASSVVLLGALSPSPSLSSWLYQNLLQCFQTLQLRIRGTRQEVLPNS